MLQGLRFDLVVYTPYKAVDGLYEVRRAITPLPPGPVCRQELAAVCTG